MLKKKYIKSRKITKITFEVPRAELPEGLKPIQLAVAGDFNDWEPDSTPMKLARGGLFRAQIEVEPGSRHHFRYVADGQHWFNDWHADAYSTNSFGEENSVLIVAEQ